MVVYKSTNTFNTVKSCSPSSYKEGEKKNKGGVAGGIYYLDYKMRKGLMSSIEGATDYVIGGIAKLFGFDKFAERQFANSWHEKALYNPIEKGVGKLLFGDSYGNSEEWFNAGKGWKVAGDITGGIGTSLPSLAAAALTGGQSAWVSMPTTFATAALPAAGNATGEAYNETGKLTGKELGYGAITGTFEGGIELVTNLVGFGTEAVVKSFGKHLSKEVAESAVRQGVGITLAKSFAGEAFEEGAAEIMSGQFKRWTYDPNAENATAGEVLYSSFIGGMSGALMGGAGSVYSSVQNISRGNALVNEGKAEQVLSYSEYLTQNTEKYNLNYKPFKQVASTYKKLTDSLTKTGGKVTTIAQKRMLGELKIDNIYATITPKVYNTATNIVSDPDLFIKKMNAYGYTDTNGNPITITKEQLMKGVDEGNLQSSIPDALESNEILRNITMMSMAGEMMINTSKFQESVLRGERFAGDADLDSFLTQASPEEVQAVQKLLGVEDLNKVSAETFNERVAALYASGIVDEALVQYRAHNNANVEAVVDTGSKAEATSNKNVDPQVTQNNAQTPTVDIKENSELAQRIKNSAKSKYDVIRDFLIEKFYGQEFTLTDGKKAIMDKRDAKELSHKSNTARTTQLANLKSIVENAIYSHSTAAAHKKFSEFHYYAVDVKCGKDVFNLWINVGVAKNDGSNHIYSITNRKEAPTNYGVSRPVGNAIQNASSDNIISKNSEIVKENSKKTIDSDEKALPNEEKSSSEKAEAEERKSMTVAESTMRGEKLAGELDLGNFLANPDENLIRGVEEALGIENLREVSPEFLNERVKAYEESGALDRAYEIYRNRANGTAQATPTAMAQTTAQTVAENTATPINAGVDMDSKVEGVTDEDIGSDKNVDSMTSYERAVGEEVANFIEEVNQMLDKTKQSKRKKRIGIISKNHADIINQLMRKINPNFSAEGYELWIDGTGATHIEARHGKNGKQDKSMATRSAKQRIPWGAQNAETGEFLLDNDGNIKLSDRFRNSDGSRAPEIRLEKSFSDGTIYVSECVPDSTNRRIYITSAYIKKSSKGQVLNMDLNKSPQLTPEASFDSNATNDIIPKNFEIVKENSKKTIDSDKKALPNEEKSPSEKAETVERKSMTVAESAKFAQENVPEYNNLGGTEQAKVRRVIRQAKANGFTDAQTRAYARVSARSGIDIDISKDSLRYTDKDGNVRYADGLYSPSRNKIYVNPEGSRSPARVLIHELTHAIYKDASGKLWLEEGVKNLSDNEKHRILETYFSDGKVDIVEYADELNAHYTEALLDDDVLLEKLCDKNPTLEDKILSFFDKASKDYADEPTLSREAKKLYKKYKKLFEVFSEVNQYGEAKADGEERYALYEFQDGKRFVKIEIDQDQFDGLSVKEQTDLATKIIKNRFKGKVIGLDNKVFVNGVSANEYTHPSKHIDDDLYTAKMRASTELDNLMDAGFNFTTGDDGRDGHIHESAVGGFSYFDVIFEIANEYYQGLINIENNRRGKRLKDITQIKNITKDVMSQYGNNPTYIFLRDASMDSIYENPEKSNPSDEKTSKNLSTNSGERMALPDSDLDNGTKNALKITKDMSDSERYEVLKHRSVSLSAETNKQKLKSVKEKLAITDADIEYSDYGDRKNLLRKIAGEFNVFKPYYNGDVQLDFVFSRGNLKHSISSQHKNYTYFVKMLSCLDDVIDNAVGIEIHKHNQYKPDPTLDNVYVLASAFVDGENIVPVELEIKEFKDKDNTLYVAIALESIKKDEVNTQGNTENGVTKQYAHSSTISISDYFKKINPLDKNFIKYIPDGFLDTIQLNAKREALEADVAKGKGEKIRNRLALPDTDTDTVDASDSVGKRRKQYEASRTEKLFDAADSIYIDMVDEMHGVKKYLKKIGKRKNADSIIQAVRASMSAAQTMLGDVQYDIFSDDGKKLGEGLSKIMKPITVKGDVIKIAFNEYLMHHLNVDRMTLEERTGGKVPNKSIFGANEQRAEAITAEQSRKRIAELEKAHPDFKEVAEKIWAYTKNINHMRVEAGLISAESEAYMSELYPHYVPAYRDTKGGGIAAIKGKRNIAISSTVKRAKGSGLDILDVGDSIAAQTQEMIRAGRINQPFREIYDIAKTGEGTEYVEIVSREKVSREQVASDSVETELAEGIELRPKNNQITGFINGEKVTIQVSDKIFIAFENMSKLTVDPTSTIGQGAKKVNDIYKKLLTSWSPIFSIRNAIRDFQDAGLNTKHPALFYKNFAKAYKLMFENSEQWQIYRAYGGYSASIFGPDGFSADVDSRGFEAMAKLFDSDAVTIKTVYEAAKRGGKNIFVGINNLNAFVEQATRFAEFLASVEAGDSMPTAINNSAEVTTNFGRRGRLAKKLNATIMPFLNPAIQGFDKIFRNVSDAFEEGTPTAVAKALGLLFVKAAAIGLAPMAVNLLLYGDDEDYEELREADKENNFLIKVGDTFIKIPRGRVASIIGGSLNRTVKLAKGEDPDVKDYLSNVLNQVTPVQNLTRTIASPFFDVKNNLTWYGTAIEGREFENTAPKDRYDENTSSIAIAIGKVINYSPKKIHYLIDQYSGVIGDFVLPMTTNKAEKDFLSGNFTIDPATSNKLSTKFYKVYDKSQYAKTAGDDTAKYQVRYLNKVKKAISEMYDEKSEIQNSDLSGAEKLQQTRVVQILINEAYKTAMTDFEVFTKAVEATVGIEDEDLRYTEATRIVYGSERALSEYNGAVYEKCQTLSLAGIDYDSLYYYYFSTKDLESDKDKNGNTISGSKRKKVLAEINKLKLKTEQKLILLASKGYSLSDAEKKRVLQYIMRLKIDKNQKAALAEQCGFEVKNGKIIIK